MITLNGREIASAIKLEVASQVEVLKHRGIKPKIHVIMATKDPSAD
jgi:5,10-methylene-tetrahydrofolate dehydrogenase/methenyl tetrahydrofolate cyclohydrolase